MKQTITLREPVQAHREIMRLWPLIKSTTMAGTLLDMEFRLHDDAKTDRQRAYYHGVVLKSIADQARPNGDAFPLKVWKEHFRSEFLGFKTLTVKNPITGKKHRRRERVSTEDLGVRGYSRLIDQVSAFAANELAVTIPSSFDQWDSAAIDPETGEIL